MRGNSKAAAARKPRKQALFLKALTETVNVTLSCRKAGVPRRTVYDWREADAAFADRWDEALEEGIDLLEAEVHRRAFEGVERPVYYKGERVGEWRHYSDALATFLLRAHRPEKYRDAPKAGASAEEDKAEEKTEEELEYERKAQAYRKMMEEIWAEAEAEQAAAAGGAWLGPDEDPPLPPPPNWPPEDRHAK